ALGCGAHLLALRRTAVGDLDIAQAHTLAALETLAATDEAALTACLMPVDSLLRSLPEARLTALASERFRHGNPVEWAGKCAEDGGMARVYDADGKLLGVGEQRQDGRLWPKRLLATSCSCA
ncbi:MAG: tRNA pseudouridine(55) synthase TruB, partial [Zoogloeaceae bacterium]|nr:tRNA pseudouridine(55) synthase TruB [Zoogloeaceae bacterium]